MLNFEFANFFDDGSFTDLATGWTVNGAVFWYALHAKLPIYVFSIF